MIARSDLRLLRQLVRNDLRLIARDKMLLAMALFILVLGVATRLGLPVVDASLARAGILTGGEGSMRLSDMYPAFVVFVAVWQGANLPGVIFGFLLLDEKEDDTLRAMRVTPLPFALYTAYRVAIPAAIAFATTLYLSLIAGVCGLGLGQLLPIAVGGALTAPLAVLSYATFAANKVQGLAYTKFAGVAGLSILFGFFAPEPWQWCLGVFPPFLVAKAYWMALEGRALFWVPLAVGIVAQLAVLRWLMRRFEALAGLAGG